MVLTTLCREPDKNFHENVCYMPATLSIISGILYSSVRTG